MNICIVKDCDRPAHGFGYCTKHYQRWKKYGDTAVNFYDRSKIDRFWSKVDRHGPLPSWRPKLGYCWIWNAARDKDGYGRFTIKKGLMVMAHRFSFEIAYGPIDRNLQIDHLCRVRECVNPWHMELVTASINTLRGFNQASLNKQKTHCKWGHELTTENVYNPPKYPSRRCCRKCIARNSAARSV